MQENKPVVRFILEIVVFVVDCQIVKEQQQEQQQYVRNKDSERVRCKCYDVR